ncbi:hypothetical protein TNCV_454451 [Trichonephila clavipes]|nr:hypothetical protein TNCV_454451 [Trichonephila clavipes]
MFNEGTKSLLYFMSALRFSLGTAAHAYADKEDAERVMIFDEKEYTINSKYSRFDNFLISTSSSCASASCSNARELDEQILEVKINPQEKNTVSDTSTNKDTLSKEKKSKNENEETKLIKNDFAHYVGTPIDANLREQILKLGLYQPEGNFQKDAKGRSFPSSYSFISKAGQKIERKWLCSSTRLHVAYCQVCWLFADRTNMCFKEAWCKGVIDWYVTTDVNDNNEPDNIRINETFLGFIEAANQTAKSLEKVMC